MALYCSSVCFCVQALGHGSSKLHRPQLHANSLRAHSLEHRQNTAAASHAPPQQFASQHLQIYWVLQQAGIDSLQPLLA
jgi:hypothetical protein